jgi:hypothetical protein
MATSWRRGQQLEVALRLGPGADDEDIKHELDQGMHGREEHDQGTYYCCRPSALPHLLPGASRTEFFMPHTPAWPAKRAFGQPGLVGLKMWTSEVRYLSHLGDASGHEDAQLAKRGLVADQRGRTLGEGTRLQVRDATVVRSADIQEAPNLTLPVPADRGLGGFGVSLASVPLLAPGVQLGVAGAHVQRRRLSRVRRS